MPEDKYMSVVRAFDGGPLYRVPEPGDMDFVGPAAIPKIDESILAMLDQLKSDRLDILGILDKPPYEQRIISRPPYSLKPNSSMGEYSRFTR